MLKTVELSVNDRQYQVDVEPNRTLAELLREDLGLTGTKVGCNLGDCGSCTVLVEGEPVNACLFLAIRANGKRVITVEGLETEGKLHPLQVAFIDRGAIQCGFCTPGMLLSAKSLLDRNPRPTEPEIKESISGNLCRCTGYQKIVEAIGSLAKDLDRGKQ